MCSGGNRTLTPILAMKSRGIFARVFAIFFGLISSLPTQTNAEEVDFGKELSDLAIAPYAGMVDDEGLVRWAALPSIKIHFLFAADASEVRIAKEEAEQFQIDCGCIGFIQIVGSDQPVALRKNEILVLVDKGGFSRFAELAYGVTAEILQSPIESYPREIGKSTLRFGFRLDKFTIAHAVSVLALNGKENAERSLMFSAFMAGVTPAVLVQGVFEKATEHVNLNGIRYTRPSDRYLELLRRLYHPRLRPGMTIPEIELAN
jgi:hypothetical protein